MKLRDYLMQTSGDYILIGFSGFAADVCNFSYSGAMVQESRNKKSVKPLFKDVYGLLKRRKRDFVPTSLMQHFANAEVLKPKKPLK